MRNTPRAPGPLLLTLFAVSGFAALIYQSLWSHYLGRTLGHAAYAQGLVLAIFMGGMALGAWLAGKWGGQWRRLLGVYALAEALIGVFGLAFEPLFGAYTGLSQDHALPALGAGWAGALYPWLSAALLILPACVLLGATFPLLSVGYLRATEEAEGRVLGGLYFANSLGAAGGALAATFLLMPAFGLPGAMRFAGIANLLVAAAAWVVSWRLEGVGVGSRFRFARETGTGMTGTGSAAADSATTRRTRGSATLAGTADADPALARRLLWVAALSGACSFVYELGWIRLLNQALGTTLHAFELMLAAFLLGLAFGGAWVRRRGARIDDALRAAGFAQIAMGVAALLSLVAFAHSFGWVGWLMAALARNDGGYQLFTLGSAAIAILVMFPAAFFAGTTLPLFTLALLRAGSGEAGIGRLYAANTLGAIVGVLAMMHLLIPLLGVRLGLVLAALADAALGFWLLGRSRGEWPLRRAGAAALAVAGALVVALTLGRPDPREQAAGVFRGGAVRLSEESEVPFLRDGKTATIGIVRSRSHDSAAIVTNGKSDAAMALSLRAPPRGDEYTMTMLGALPLALHPDPRSVGVIGWGSGLTTHTLLGSPRVHQVETVEIEPAVHAGARLFGERVERAYSDPRSQVHFDDARRYFASARRRYDVIVSEPSNPWVSGVASLFTREFYAFLRGHLAEDGVLVQWLQTYEIDDALLASMLAALLAEFPDAEAYLAHDVDLVVVAYPEHRTALDVARLRHPALEAELRRVGLAEAEEWALRRIGGRALLRTFVHALNAVPHTDARPRVALRAPATRFRRAQSDTLQSLVDNGLPVLDFLEGRQPPPASAAILRLDEHRFTRAHHDAAALVRALREPPGGKVELSDPRLLQPLQALRALSSHGPVRDAVAWADAAATVAAATLGLLPAADLDGAWIEPAWIDPEANQPEAVRRILAMYAAAARRDAARMRQAGENVLRLPDRMPAHLDEQALVIAQLGAIGQDDPAAVEALYRGYGIAIAHGERMRMVRHVLRVWALERSPRPYQPPPVRTAAARALPAIPPGTPAGTRP